MLLHTETISGIILSDRNISDHRITLTIKSDNRTETSYTSTFCFNPEYSWSIKEYIYDSASNVTIITFKGEPSC